MPLFDKNPLAGLIGSRTAAFFRLDPTGTVPIELVADLVPALTPNRITLDVVDTEDYQKTFLVTNNALQDFTSAQSNIHRELERMTITGTLVSSIDIPVLGSVGLGGFLRSDLRKMENLEALADRREPIMVVTPRRGFPKAFIESLGTSWNPATGENTLATISIIEARIVNPLLAASAVLDVEGSYTGNNILSDAGAQSGSEVDVQAFSQGAVGLPPILF